MSINARPHINGNSKVDFFEAYKAVVNAREAMQKARGKMLSNVLHGRNYQHCESSYDVVAVDRLQFDEKMSAVFRAISEFESDFEEIFNSIYD